MKTIGAVNMPDEVTIFPGEAKAVEEVLWYAEQYGYGNLIAHLRTAWAVRLRDQGVPEDSAIKATDVSPYPLPKRN